MGNQLFSIDDDSKTTNFSRNPRLHVVIKGFSISNRYNISTKLMQLSSLFHGYYGFTTTRTTTYKQ